MGEVPQGRPQPLFRLMQQVANSHKHQSGAVIVGYTMKPSRERALAARGLLPLAPLHNVCFVPVDFAHPLDEQGPFDVILHKVRVLTHPTAVSSNTRRTWCLCCVHTNVCHATGYHVVSLHICFTRRKVSDSGHFVSRVSCSCIVRSLHCHARYMLSTKHSTSHCIPSRRH